MTYFLTRAFHTNGPQVHQDTRPEMNRRRFVAGSLAAASLALPSTAPATSNEILPNFPEGQIRSEFLNYENPEEHQRQSFRILRNLKDNGDVLFWYHFQMYAVIEGRRPEPVVRWEGIEFSHHQKMGPSVYRVGGHNLSFPRDLATGRWIDKVLNPVTGKTVAVPPIALTEDPGYLYTPKGVIPLDNPSAPPRIRHEQFLIEGDLIKIEQVRQPPASWPATFIETSVNWSPLKLYEDESVLDLPTGTSGGYVFPWPAWMNMGDQQGHMFAIWSGRKLKSVESLPDEFMRRAQGAHPELLEVDRSRFAEPLPEPLMKWVAANPS